LKELKESFLDAYDENDDGKIEISEVRKTKKRKDLILFVF